MFRTSLAGAAFATLILVPGCGIFADRPGLCNRRAQTVSAVPVSYPASVGDAGCGSSIIPPGSYGQPIYGAPGGTIIQGDPSFPMIPPAKIAPRAGVEEKGKQFELDGASRPSGPAIMFPAINGK